MLLFLFCALVSSCLRFVVCGYVLGCCCCCCRSSSSSSSSSAWSAAFVVVAPVVTAVRRCVAVLGVLVLGLLLVCVCFSHPTFYCIFEMFCDARVSVQKLGLEWTDVMSSTEARSPAFVFSKANAGRWSPRRLKWEIISCAFSVHIHSRKAGLVEVTSVTAVAPVDDLVTREGGHVSREILFITLSSTCFQTFHFSLLRFLFYFGKPPKT